MYRLFSWEHSYFSGKARAFLRFKQRAGSLAPGWEDVLATPELIAGLLLPRSGSNAVPQLETPAGDWVQDSSEIIDHVEAAHPEVPVVPSPEAAPRQCLVSYLLELFADEWMLVPAFWERWYFSENGRAPSHRGHNEQQWGAVAAAGQPGTARRAAGAALFEDLMGISHSRKDPKGTYAGLVHLGCDERTEKAWQASQHRVLGMLETHFAAHDYVLGGRPGLADFALLGPLYAHVYRDAVSGFALRVFFPITAEWVERANGEGALNARTWGQKLYSLDEKGALVGRPATSDGGEWLPDDAIPETLLPVLGVFFEEMWPVLVSSMRVLADFIASDAHTPGDPLPGGSFMATPGFLEHQTGEGALTHEFEIGGVTSRRMVIPYQVWMLQRLERVLSACTADAAGRAAVESLLGRLPRGLELFELGERLEGCRVRKERGRLSSVAAH
jgi:glutathione S-transferase